MAWVFCEAPGLLATTDLQIAALNGPVGQRKNLCALGVSLRGTGNDDTLLALADPYLRWLEPR